MSRLPSPALCLVTDRRRLAGSYPEHHESLARLLAHIADAAAAGIDFVQIRERDLDARPLADLVSRAVALTRGTRTRILVNDRADLALAAGADGVHLRSDSPPGPRVREILGADALVGRSVHSAAEARDASEAGGLDYLILGTVFPSASKTPGDGVIGPGELAAAARQVRIPVLAIGGIAGARLRAVAASGAAGIAAIGYFVPPPGASARRREALHGLAAAARRAFDTPEAVP